MGADKTSRIPKGELDELIEIVLNPNTSLEKLAELSQIDDFEIRKYIPLNHWTSFDVMEMLIDDATYDYSILVDATRVFPTHLQQKIDTSVKINSQIMREDNPDELRKLFDTVPPKFMLNFTINDHTPADILEKIFTFDLVPLNRRIASNRNTPNSIFDKLVQTNDNETLKNLAENPKTPPHILSEIAERGRHFTRLIKNQNTPASVLSKIYDMSKHSQAIVHSIAIHDNADAELLDQLTVESKSLQIKQLIAKHPNTSSNTLETLVDQIPMKSGEYFDDYYIPDLEKYPIVNVPTDFFYFTDPVYFNLGNNLALNPNTPPRALENLFNHGWTYKEHLMMNPNTPENIKERAKRDVIAMRKVEDDNTTTEELDTFVDYYHPFVRVQLASNPNISQNSLSKLAEDDNFIVQLTVASNIETPQSSLRKLAGHRNIAVRWRVVKNHNTPDDVLYDLLDEDIDFLNAIAEHQNATEKTIDELNIRKKQIMSDRATAKNETTPKAILEKLSNHKDHQVKQFVALNQNTPENILHKLAFEQRSEIEIPSRQIIIVKDYSEHVAQNPKTSTNMLRKIYEANPNIKTKRAIFNNPQTPIEIRRDLLEFFLNEYGWIENDRNLDNGEKQLKILHLRNELLYLISDPLIRNEMNQYESLIKMVEILKEKEGLS